MEHTDKFQLIREKIVRTDEVIKLLLEKNTAMEKIESKYQTALRKYLEKCNQYTKLKKECDILCISNDEQLNKISKLEEELSLRKIEFDNLNSTYVDQVNKSMLQYQVLNTKLEDSQNRAKEQEKQISLLESVKKQQCKSCAKIMKNKKRRRSESNKNEKSTKQDSDSETDEHRLFVIEAKTEISSLQNTLSVIRLDNEKLRNDFKKVESDCNMLRECNTTLKRSMKEEKRKNVKLQERINALLLEIEVLNFNHAERGHTQSIGVQTNSTNEDVATDSDMLNSICDELINLPRLISPLEDLKCSSRISKSPVASDVPFVDDDARSDAKLKGVESDILNSSFSSVHSEMLLDTGQLSTKCCSDYAASMHVDESGESRLLGFVPVSVPVQENYCDRIKTRKKIIRKRKGFMKQCSDQIYKRVLEGVLKYIHSRKRKQFSKNNTKRLEQRVRIKAVTEKKVKVALKNDEKNTKNCVTRKKTKRSIQSKADPAGENTIQDNSFEHFCYDVPPDSVDSGYSAQMSTGSECSEILTCKFSESISELNVQSTENCDIKRRKIELFGSESESDDENFVSKNSNFKNDEVQGKDAVGSVHLKADDSGNRNTQDYSRTTNITSHLIRDNQSQNSQQVLSKPVLLAAGLTTENNVKKCNNVTNTVIIEKTPQNNSEKTVFKRPNCRKRVIESPRSPDPVQEHDTLPHKAVIPLKKPKRLGAVVMGKLFEKLITYPDEPKVLEEVTSKLINQKPSWIARYIIDVITADYHSKVEVKDNPFAPLLTFKQKVLLGFMIKLENENTSNIIISFIIECEKRILQEKSIEHIVPLTGLYLAVCKLKSDVHRMRKTCLDALYFMGDLVIPFLYTVLSSWPEVLPTQNEAIGSILPKVIVQVINLKTCNLPGYNLLNLRTVISRLHGYPSERWNSDKLFAEIVSIFKEHPTRQDTSVALVILCKNHSASWVAERLEKLADVTSTSENLLLKEKTLDLLTQIIKQFDKTRDATFIEKVESSRKRLSNT